MPKDIMNFLPAQPPYPPLPRFLVNEITGKRNNPLTPEELGRLEGKYGKWAARLGEAFGTDFASVERIAKSLSERILRRL